MPEEMTPTAHLRSNLRKQMEAFRRGKLLGVGGGAGKK